jgi:hypothetical protein
VKSATHLRRNKPTKEVFSFSSAVPRYANKVSYVQQNVTFAIAAVELDPGGGFVGDNRWKVTVLRDDTQAFEIITLPCNEKRDAQMQAAQAHIAASRPITSVRLVKHGNAYYFRGAEDRT